MMTNPLLSRWQGQGGCTGDVDDEGDGDGDDEDGGDGDNHDGGDGDAGCDGDDNHEDDYDKPPPTRAKRLCSVQARKSQY